MRFSNNGYYIEKYIKCANCGMLIYGDGINGVRHDKPALFCSDWCVRMVGPEGDGPQRHSADDRAAASCRSKRPGHRRPPRRRPVDLVTMNILDSTMVSICREMGILLMKTSYSTIFNEGLDFTCALADAKGDMIACAEFCPTHDRRHAAADQDAARRRSRSRR